MASAATRIHNARTNGATNFSSQIGDRIIIEIGWPWFYSRCWIDADACWWSSATADFALTSGLTTDLCPWVRLSRTVLSEFHPLILWFKIHHIPILLKILYLYRRIIYTCRYRAWTNNWGSRFNSGTYLTRRSAIIHTQPIILILEVQAAIH